MFTARSERRASRAQSVLFNTPAGLALLLLAGLVLAACGSTPTATPVPATATPPPPTAIQASPAAGAPTPGPMAGFQALPASSVHVVGPNRFAIGLVRDGRSVKDAQVKLQFFDLTAGQAVLKDEQDAPYYGDNLGEAGVYVARTRFDKAGEWGVQVTAQEPNRAPEVERFGFTVLAQDPSPGIGQPAPRSKTVTLADVAGNRRQICSAAEDDSALHRISIEQAVTNGKPSVILFATPAFCTSRTCGPSLQVVKALADNYGDRVNFVHIEVYKEFEKFTLADVMGEWQLKTEPWLFFVDKDGIIVDKFEGGITSREIVPAFQKFIGEK